MKINPKIAALAKLVGDSNRLALQNVLCDGKRAVVCDGAQLTVVTDKAEDAEAGTPTLLSVEALDLIKKLPSKHVQCVQSVHIEQGETMDTVKVLNINGDLTAQATTAHATGTYVDYKRVQARPDSVPIRYQYNAKLLVKVLQGIIDLDKGNKQAIAVGLEFGDCCNPMRITWGNSEFEVESTVMPCRDSVTNGPNPAKEKLERAISERITEAAKQIRAEMESKPEVEGESEAA